MKNAYEVLQEREAELARVRKEIDSLNIVARLLAENDSETAAGNLNVSSEKSDEKLSSPLSETILRLSDAAANGAESLFASVANSRSGFWNALKRAT